MLDERLRKIISNTIGYFCIFVFFSLTSYIVYTFYSTIAPTVLYKRHYEKFLFHFIFGNWLAINIYFNYIMAWLTSPGLAKNQRMISHHPICPKCSFNKPPRTHHCGWCNLCVLKYDHHCPWLNNCIGFYNHRYFFQFCCFMSIGCLYAGTFGYQEYQISKFGMILFEHKDSFFMASDIFHTMGVSGFITNYIFIMALVTGFLLILLSCWHGRLISYDETSVERLINSESDHRYYRKGSIIKNWKRFLGIASLHEFFRRILLPSTHKPRGNGIDFDYCWDIEYQTNFPTRQREATRKSSFQTVDIMQGC